MTTSDSTQFQMAKWVPCLCRQGCLITKPTYLRLRKPGAASFVHLLHLSNMWVATILARGTKRSRGERKERKEKKNKLDIGEDLTHIWSRLYDGADGIFPIVHGDNLAVVYVKGLD